MTHTKKGPISSRVEVLQSHNHNAINLKITKLKNKKRSSMRKYLKYSIKKLLDTEELQTTIM